jgi:hypothetical protein
VEVGVQVAPAGISGLAIEIDGSITALDAPRKSIKRGLEPVTIKVAAPGFRSVELAVVPDRERSVMVTLVPSAAPVAASASASPVVVPAPRAPAPASSGVIRRYPF